MDVERRDSDGKPFARRLLTNFLKTRRAALRPADVGLPGGSRLRRTPGLRRTEVAQLAGISVEWYTLFEMGRDRAMTPHIIGPVSEALRLNETERDYVYDLVLAEPPPKPSFELSPAVELLLRDDDKLVTVYDRWLNPVRWTSGAGVLFSIAGACREKANALWRLFCAPDGRQRFSGWEQRARFFLGMFRRSLGRDPVNPEAHRVLASIEPSPAFKTLWELHEVRSLDDEARIFSDAPLRVCDPIFGEVNYFTAGFSIPGSSGGQVRIAVPIDTAGQAIVRKTAKLWSSAGVR